MYIMISRELLTSSYLCIVKKTNENFFLKIEQYRLKFGYINCGFLLEFSVLSVVKDFIEFQGKKDALEVNYMISFEICCIFFKFNPY